LVYYCIIIIYDSSLFTAHAHLVLPPSLFFFGSGRLHSQKIYQIHTLDMVV